MEKDDEIKGNNNSIDYVNRFYDPRVGRFLSIDPLTSQFPFYTPYQFAGNKPTVAIDLDGLEELDFRILQQLDYGDIKVNMADAPGIYRLNGRAYKTELKMYNGVARKHNAQWYFNQSLEKAPDFWSKENAELIRAGKMPTPDDTYLKKIGKNLNEEDFAELKRASMRPRGKNQIMSMEHHHLNHGDNAIGLPWNVHRGKGNTKFWHTFKKVSKKAGKSLPLVGGIYAVASTSDASASTVGQDALAEGTMGLSFITSILVESHLGQEKINESLTWALNGGYDATMKFINGSDDFKVYYASVEETMAFINEGTMPLGEDSFHAGYTTVYDIANWTDGKKIAPYAFIFKDGAVMGILEVPMGDDADFNELFDIILPLVKEDE